jgi:hypothetical protein
MQGQNFFRDLIAPLFPDLPSVLYGPAELQPSRNGDVQNGVGDTSELRGIQYCQRLRLPGSVPGLCDYASPLDIALIPVIDGLLVHLVMIFVLGR